MTKRQQYTKEFKLEAVRFWKSSGRPAAAIARELGLRRNQLYKWQRDLRSKGERAFRGRGRKSLRKQSEVERLKAELKQVTEERDILKKAEAYFAKELK